MIQWLHNYIPQPILFQWGWLSVYWYGLIIAGAIVIGFVLTSHLAKQRGFVLKIWYDILFYAMIGGLVGARLYHVLLEVPYYFTHPLAILQVWQGGLAIHGAIIGGGLVIYYLSRRYKLVFVKILDILVLAMILGQAMGRWGNYFNQELFGLPTSQSWGIFISVVNRPVEFMSNVHFHPTFLYEFCANLLLFILLLIMYKYKYKIVGLTTSVYLVGYSIIRFCLEFIRIDRTPDLWGLRWPQWASIIIVILVGIYWFYQKGLQKSNKPV